MGGKSVSAKATAFKLRFDHRKRISNIIPEVELNVNQKKKICNNCKFEAYYEFVRCPLCLN